MSLDIDTERVVGVATTLDGQVEAADLLKRELTAMGQALDVAEFCAPLGVLLGEFIDEIGGAADVLRLRAQLAEGADTWSSAAYQDKVAELHGLVRAVRSGLDDGVGSSGEPGLWNQLTDWANGLPFAERPGARGGAHFVIGDPTRPRIEWDDDFIYDSKDSNWRDHLNKQEWMLKLAGGRLLKSDLDDATQFYRHYWDNNGEPIEFDYEEAYVEDRNVRLAIDNEIARAQQGAEMLFRDGNRTFSMSGDATATSSAEYPDTENWQKTIGGHQVWSSANVSVVGDTATMTVTVHGEDYYNFNRGQSDIGSGASDDENGRFTEIGWAKPFESSGSVVRTVTWNIGDASSTTTSESGSPERNPGREDNEIERDAGDPDRSSVPDNNRDTGHTRVDG